jgi:hypothetical protein
MSDSAEKNSELPVQKPAVTEEIIKRPEGTFVTMNRGEGGKFVKKARTMPKSLDVTRLMRKLLASPVANANGKFDKGAESRIKQMFDNIFEIAATNPNQPLQDKFGNVVLDEKGKVVTYMDAKCAMASVQAFKELMLRAYGMPSKSDEEMEALKTQGVKIVIITPPAEMMNQTVKEDKPRERLVPAFLDAEIVENK